MNGDAERRVQTGFACFLCIFSVNLAADKKYCKKI